MPDKILPTRTDAIAVRPESIPTPEGKSERRELRTVNSKTFLHPEKAADGKEIRTCHATLGAVCYRDDNGELRSIDTTIRDLDGKIGIEWAPYKFTLHETGIGFTFESRQGGWCGVHLTHVGDMQIDGDAVYASEIVDNVVTFKNVQPGCDIVFKCLNDRVKTLRILHDENAPRTFEWMTQDDILRGRDFIVNELSGTDADGKSLTLTCEATQIDRASFRVTETWTGETQDKTPVAYPVEIDPTVTVNPAANADDIYETGGGIGGNPNLLLGSGLNLGIRFPNLTVPNAATVSLATLGLYQNSHQADPGGGGTVYGRLIDDCPQFAAGGNLPSEVTKTTATATYPPSTVAGQKTITVTSIVQEVVNLGGWASGHAIGFPIIGNQATYSYINSYDSGSNIPYLEITYTAAAGGTAGKPLMLLGCG